MKALTWLASFLTIIGVNVSNLINFWADATFWTRFFFVAALLASLALAVAEIGNWWKTKAKRHKNAKSVNKYMLKLLKRGGSAAIFANNLTWVSGAPAIRELLTSEAAAGRDICLFVPRLNALTAELAANGMKVNTYEGLGYDPSARFTLLNPDEPGSSLLAIGTGIFPNFYIEEFSDATHSRVIAVVRDLLNILERVNDRAHA